MADDDGMTPIDSSVVKGYSYNPDSRELRVRFPNGDIHQYEDVPIEKVHTLAGAESPGRYFNEKIRGIHLSKKVSP